MEILEDAIADDLKDRSMPWNFSDESEDSTASVGTMNIIETAAIALRRCSLLLEKSSLSGALESEEEATEITKNIKTARSDTSEDFDMLIQSCRDRLEILTTINCFLCRATKLVDESESKMSICEDYFSLIEESFELMRSIRNKIQNNSDNIAMLGFRLLEQLHVHLPAAESSSKSSLTKTEEDNTLDVNIYQEKLLQTDLGTWLKSVNMINTLLDKAEKLTSYVALQKVFGLGKELITNMSKTMKACFDNSKRSKDITKKLEKRIEQSRLYNEETKIQKAESDNLSDQILELKITQIDLEETIKYYQSLVNVLRRGSLTDGEKLKAQESLKPSEDKTERLEAETDDPEAENTQREELKLYEKKLQEQQASAKVLRQNIQKLELITRQLEILKEEKKPKKRTKFLESLEKIAKQEHHEVTSSEQVQDTVQATSSPNLHQKDFTQEEKDASAVSLLSQHSSRPQEVQKAKKTLSTSDSKKRSSKEPLLGAFKKHPSPESGLARTSSSRSSEIENVEKTQSQQVLMTILNQLKDIKGFLVKTLATKDMFELAKQLDSLEYCETDADGEQTIKLSSPSFRYVLDNIQTILSKVFLSAAPKKEVITLTGWTAANEKVKTMETNFANLFRKYQDLWFMYFQLRGKLKNELAIKLSAYKEKTSQPVMMTSSLPNLQFVNTKPQKMIERKEKLTMNRERRFHPTSYLQAKGNKFSKTRKRSLDLHSDLPPYWKENLQNTQAAFAEGEINRDTYTEFLVLMLKLAAVMQEKISLLGEGFMMERLKQSRTEKIQRILQAVSSEDFPLYLLMKDADYDNYTAFLREINAGDKKKRLEQEKILLFMQHKNLYKKIKDRRKRSVNTMQFIPEKAQTDFAQFKSCQEPVREHRFSVTIDGKKNHQMRVTQSLTAHLPAAARLEDQTPTFFSFSISGIPKVIRSLTEIQKQIILEEAEEVQDLVSETLASEEGEELCLSETISEEGKFPLLQKFVQKKHTVLSKHQRCKLPLQRPLDSLMLTLPPIPVLPTEKDPCPSTVRYSLSNKTLTSVPSHFHSHKEYVIPRLYSQNSTIPQIRLKHKQQKVPKKILADLLTPSLLNIQKILSSESSSEFPLRSPQKQALASYLYQTQEHTECLQNEEHEFSSLKQEALGDHRDSPAGSESKILPEEEKQEVSLPLSVGEQIISPLDQPSTIRGSKGKVSHFSEVKAIYKNDRASLSGLRLPSSATESFQFTELQSDKKVTLKTMVLNKTHFPEFLPDPITDYQSKRHLLLNKKILFEIYLNHKRLKEHQVKLPKRLPCPSTLHSVLNHEISPDAKSKHPQMDSHSMLMQTHAKDLVMQIRNIDTVQRLPQHKASSQNLILNVKKWIRQIEQKVEERQNGKPATLPALPTDLISFKDFLREESKSDLSLSSLDFEYNLKPDLPESEGVSLSLDHENKLESVSPKCDEGTEWSKTCLLHTLSEDSDDRSDASDSSLREMTAFCTEVPLLFYLDVDQSRRKASRILNLMVCQDLSKIPTEPCCQHVWNKFLSEQ